MVRYVILPGIVVHRLKARPLTEPGAAHPGARDCSAVTSRVRCSVGPEAEGPAFAAEMPPTVPAWTAWRLLWLR